MRLPCPTDHKRYATLSMDFKSENSVFLCSGFITCQEMIDQFSELGGLLSADEIHKFHSVLDRDGNGVIDVCFH